MATVEVQSHPHQTESSALWSWSPSRRSCHGRTLSHIAHTCACGLSLRNVHVAQAHGPIAAGAAAAAACALDRSREWTGGGTSTSITSLSWTLDRRLLVRRLGAPRFPSGALALAASPATAGSARPTEASALAASFAPCALEQPHHRSSCCRLRAASAASSRGHLDLWRFPPSVRGPDPVIRVWNLFSAAVAARCLASAGAPRGLCLDASSRFPVPVKEKPAAPAPDVSPVIPRSISESHSAHSSSSMR
mmetsp:Transcript_30181/g.79270  ORF Transcript_30181/g.79270 Transcript_30181/m.79270 type:complete len:249 (-) Transcript_30181:330-1076(-)